MNDRGPFVDDRIIDLSYAAALKLDMVKSGTANVLVEAIDDDSSSSTNTDIKNESYIHGRILRERKCL